MSELGHQAYMRRNTSLSQHTPPGLHLLPPTSIRALIH